MEFGKFKDATSLFEAYQNLEKVFTKKCQELSDLSKKLEEERSETMAQRKTADETIDSENKNASFNNAENDLEVSEGENNWVAGQDFDDKEVAEKVGFLDSVGACVSTISEESLDSENLKPLEDSGEQSKALGNPKDDLLSRFKSSNWRKEVSKFLALCPEAKEYRADIARLIMGSDLLKNDPDCLSKAFQIAKNNRPASSEKSLQREKPYELENLKSEAPIKENGVGDDALNMTVSDLLKKVAETPKLSPRFVRAGMSAGAIGITTPRTIKSLSEAKDYLLKNYFK